MRIGSQKAETEQATGMLDDYSGLGGCHSNIGSMDGNTQAAMQAFARSWYRET